MFYKIKALAESGRKIILHYFDYKKSRNADGLSAYCTAIYSYKRKRGIKGLSFPIPYIVSSRINKLLIQRLNEDDYPILLEGIHCTGIIPFIKRGERKIAVRMHNDEAAYYKHLAKEERKLFRKLYFLWEAKLLKLYQRRLPSHIDYACISEADIPVLKKKYGLQQLHFIPAFVPWQDCLTQTGRGDYCLYHGNLLVAENEQAAIWLIKSIFSRLDFTLIIAGRNASSRLRKSVSQYAHVVLKNNPSDEELAGLIQQAQINILPSFNSTGVKLKLLHALFDGRFCITNKEGLTGSGINNTVVIASDAESYYRLIEQLMQQSFTEKEVQERKKALLLYNNQQNAAKLNLLC